MRNTQSIVGRVTRQYFAATTLGLGVGLTGCGVIGPSDNASQAGNHVSRSEPPRSSLPANYQGAVSDGLGGSSIYDQPGQLPANVGGTNAGRSCTDDSNRFENR
jgi:hypothetical protein